MPILAQLLTVGAGARTELRYVTSELDDFSESATSAGLSAELSLPYLTLSANYSPTLTVSPLESKPRDVSVGDSFNASAATGYGFQFKQSSLHFSQSASYTLENPIFQAINAPSPVPTTPVRPATPPPGDTTDGTGDQGGQAPNDTTNPAAAARRATDYRSQYWSLRSEVGYDATLSRRTTFHSTAGYDVTAGLGSSRVDYPLVQGPSVSFEVDYRLSVRDNLTSSLGAQYAFSETRNKGFVLGLSESYDHQFNRRTQGDIGVGVAYSNSQQGDGPIAHSVFPAGTAGLNYATRWLRGTLSLGARVVSAPVLDVTTATVDPRLGVSLTAGWARRRLSMHLDVSAAISLAESDTEGALRTIAASYAIAYDLGAGFSADAGVRAAWQTYAGSTIIPATTAFFVGIAWGGGTQFGHPPAVR